MSHDSFIKILQDNQLMRSFDEVMAFEQALEELAQNPNFDNLSSLHLILNDDCQQPDVMFSLVHFIESFNVQEQIQAFIQVIPILIEQAPQWTEILYTRINNDKTARTVFKTTLQSMSLEKRERIQQLLSSKLLSEVA
jgi:UDP-2,3-diacylglucosamine pyrophosphatase LpxH